MAKLTNHDQQVLSTENTGSNVINTVVGSASSNSMSTAFPSNHHLLVRHAAIETSPPAISHSQHQLNSGNSFELSNGVTTSSLSEDSGLPLTTNSSISSGDSTRMGLCKFEFELAAESDAEVSQFDSLENCSDGGMSAENFNTLKKVPLAPIDPPPEFQDSPQTTLLRSTALQSFSTKLAKNIVSTAITGANTNSIYDEVPTTMNSLLKTKSLEILPTTESERERESSSYAYEQRLPRKRNDYDEDEYQVYQCEYHLYHRTTDDFYHTYDIYASDSVLNTHIDNIYDVPCDDYPANASCDSILERGDHFAIFDDTLTDGNVSSMKCQSNRLQIEQVNAIREYDLYYQRKVKRSSQSYCERNKVPEPYSSGTSTLASNTINSTASTNDSLRPSLSGATTAANVDHIQSKSSTLSSSSVSKTKNSTSSSTTSTSVTTFQHRKTPSILYSPLHYHANSNLSTGNRPNSRNSLNSRLSSSHNSLTISSSNKADDSIFITQAMSHDALTSREISDFYNVPIDSDIYALPIDVIRPIFSSNTSRTCINRSNSSITTTTTNACTKGAKGDKTTLKSVASMQNAITHIQQLPVSTRTSMLLKSGTKHFRGRLKYVRNNKRRKRQQQSLDGGGSGASNVIPSKTCRSSSCNSSTATDKRNSVPENVINAEPKHMMLDEVKQQMMYTSLCSSSSESALELKAITKNMSNNYNGSNCNNSNSSSGRINKLALSTFGTFSSNKHSNNNNNNNSISFNHNNASNSIVILKSDRNFNLSHINNNNINNNTISANSIANSHTKLSTIPSSSVSVTSTSSTPNHHSTTIANSKLPNSKTTSKNGACIKKISSSPSIAKDSNDGLTTTNATTTAQSSTKKSQFSISLNLKQKFCSIFRFRKSYSTHHASANGTNHRDITDYDVAATGTDKKKFSTRALPPLPPKLKGTVRTESPSAIESNALTTEEPNEEREGKKNEVQTTMDFAANIEKVKEYGWYWGPISSEAAEKILSNEPDGSFIVRDSSDDHYIFSLTFKLNNCVRHVRIEQDQGTFSFGSCAKFKSRTIMEFIENAVESSRSGRYLFFFHRRPEHGPMRVQLTNPVSRFKHIQSLQHMCRFVIRRAVVRKDLIQTLPLPRRLLDYLSYKNCYSEQVESDSSQSPPPEETNDDNHSDEAEEHVILR